MTMIFRVAPMSGAGIDQEAATLLKHSQANCLDPRFPQKVDVEAIFEFDIPKLTGFKTGFCDYPDGIEGCTDVGNLTSNVSSSLLKKNMKNRRRSTIPHEAGHIWLHAPQLIRARKVLIFKDEKGRVHSGLPRLSPQFVRRFENPEWQADRFAAALLMPTEPVKACVQHGLSIPQIASLFEVSVALATSRLKGLGLLETVRAF